MNHCVAIVGICLCLAAAVACGPSDPIERALQERAQWNVQLLSWAQTESGSINMSIRLSGPVKARLEQLTVRVDLIDAEDRTVESIWESFDLSGIQRGGPEDVSLRVPAPSVEIVGIALQTLPTPTPEQIVHIPELQL